MMPSGSSRAGAWPWSRCGLTNIPARGSHSSPTRMGCHWSCTSGDSSRPRTEDDPDGQKETEYDRGGSDPGGGPTGVRGRREPDRRLLPGASQRGVPGDVPEAGGHPGPQAALAPPQRQASDLGLRDHPHQRLGQLPRRQQSSAAPEADGDRQGVRGRREHRPGEVQGDPQDVEDPQLRLAMDPAQPDGRDPAGPHDRDRWQARGGPRS